MQVVIKQSSKSEKNLKFSEYVKNKEKLQKLVLNNCWIKLLKYDAERITTSTIQM